MHPTVVVDQPDQEASVGVFGTGEHGNVVLDSSLSMLEACEGQFATGMVKEKEYTSMPLVSDIYTTNVNVVTNLD